MYIRFFLVLSVIFWYSSTVFSLNGSIIIQGDLVDEPCSLQTGSELQTVKLGNIIKNTLYLHKRTVNYPFYITLETCDISDKHQVEVSFNGEEDILQPGLLATAGTAKGIAIGIKTEEGNKAEINRTITKYELEGENQTLTFYAYISASDAVIEQKSITEGDFSAYVSFMLSYP